MKTLRISLTLGIILCAACFTQINYSATFAIDNPPLVVDEGFGITGTITSLEPITSMAIQEDGKILTLSFLPDSQIATLTRYNVDGILDTNFGSKGNGTLSLSLPDSFHSLISPSILTVQTRLDNKIIIGTLIHQPVPTFLPQPGSKALITLAYYNKDGSATQTSELKALYPWLENHLTDNTATTTLNLPYNVHISDFLLQPDGKVIVVGSLRDQLSFLARYNFKGNFDFTFGPTTDELPFDGYILNPRFNKYSHVFLQHNGKIIVESGNSLLKYIIGYNQDGTLDTTFSTQGNGIIKLESVATSLALQPDDKIITITVKEIKDEGLRYYINRYTTNGAVDVTFNTNEIYSFQKPGFFSLGLSAVQPNNKLIVVENYLKSRSLTPSLVRFKELSPEEIEQKRLAALAAQEAAALAAEIDALMQTQLIEECAICYEETALENLMETECHHFFHPHCISEWLVSGQPAAHTCPICRHNAFPSCPSRPEDFLE
jgi:uncharacterized delta-60 repeat protein